MEDKTKILIEKIKEKFGDRFDYTDTVWKPDKQKIELKCIKHDHIFYQRKDQLFAGHGCSKCGRESAALKHTYSRDDFLFVFKNIHGNKYDLDKIKFTTYDEKVYVYCEDHGYFEKTASDLISRKRGCSKCSNRVRKTNAEFIREALCVYGDVFDYSLVNYKNNKTKIEIICSIHGVFEQVPKGHLKGAIGCQKCATGKMSVSRPETEWLDSLNVIERNTKVKIDNRRPICIDGIDRDKRRVYFFHGDFWHGNPKYYPPNCINPKSKKTFGELYEKTLATEKRLRDVGYDLIVMWESDWVEKNGGKYYFRSDYESKTCFHDVSLPDEIFLDNQ